MQSFNNHNQELLVKLESRKEVYLQFVLQCKNLCWNSKYFYFAWYDKLAGWMAMALLKTENLFLCSTGDTKKYVTWLSSGQSKFRKLKIKRFDWLIFYRSKIITWRMMRPNTAIQSRQIRLRPKKSAPAAKGKNNTFAKAKLISAGNKNI